jgi:hypothetical protein
MVFIEEAKPRPWISPQEKTSNAKTAAGIGIAKIF